MKKIVLVISLILAGAVAALAQDIITTKDGTDIKAKILEVTSTEVKYKRASNPDGPTFTIAKSEILIVRYANGENEIFKDTPSASSRSSYNSYNSYSRPTADVYPGMKYSQYRRLYNTRNYVSQPGDPYSPGWAGVASFFIPGLGQALDGEWVRGLGFFFGASAWTVLGNAFYYEGEDEIALIAYGATLALDIWGIVDAIKTAKIKNMYYQDIRGMHSSLDIKLQPYFAYTPVSTTTLAPAAGLSLRLSF